MNIIHIVDSEGLYGSEKVILNLMQEQCHLGLRPVLLSIGNDISEKKDIEKQAELNGLILKTLRFSNGLNFKGTRKILQACRELHANIIHAHGYKPNILLGLLHRSLRKIPVVSTLHGYTSRRKFSKMGLYDLIDAFAIRNLDGIVSVSETIQNRWNLKLFGIKPFCIHNGIPELHFDLNYFPEHYPGIFHDIDKTFKIISIGRISEEKGHYLLLDAVKQLSVKYSVSLVLAGTGDEDIRQLKHLAEKYGVSDRLHFTGYVEDGYNLLPHFDVFALPSYSEGLPITILEAMQAAVPIVASKVGSIPKVLQNGELGILVEKGNVNSLLKALMHVHDNYSAAAERAQKARQHALNEYSIEKTAQAYLEFYKKILFQR